MKTNLTSLVVVLCLSIAACTHAQDCVDGINKRPVFGGIKKCPGQIETDQIFLKISDQQYKNRKDASAYMVTRSWHYFYKRELDTSMMRFNQAWLLDRLNADVYWGFANILGSRGDFKQSLTFFRRSINLKPGNANIWIDQSVSIYAQLTAAYTYFVQKDSAEKYLKISDKLDPRQ